MSIIKPALDLYIILMTIVIVLRRQGISALASNNVPLHWFMTALIILGAGGHARVVAETAMEQGGFSRIAFLDDHAYEQADQPTVLGWPLLGPLNGGLETGILEAYPAALVGIGDAAKRLFWLEQLCLRLFAPAADSSHSLSAPSASLGNGTVVFANSAIQTNAAIGLGSILNTGCSVDHDVHLADGVHICPGARLAVAFMLALSWIGIGACVIQRVRIGSDVTVGAGAEWSKIFRMVLLQLGCSFAMTESFGQWPYFDDAQISVATEVLRSGRVNAWTGEQTASFENEFAAV